jgi:2-hydroxychromene-2-carboxylate isomerase
VGAAPLRFLFDFISPYAYLAWKALGPLAARQGREVRAEPVLFAALLDAHGQKGPAEIPAKRSYVFKDALRRAELVGLPFCAPPSHPYNPLLALRAASLPMPEAQRHALIHGLFDAAWGSGEGVTDPTVVARVASASGLDGEATVVAAGGSDAKATLRARTEGAVREGVFGVPTVLADAELFWGYDALPFLEAHLEGRDPATPERLARWAQVVPSAQRKVPSAR